MKPVATVVGYFGGHCLVSIPPGVDLPALGTQLPLPEVEERDAIFAHSRPGDLGEEIITVGLDRRKAARD